MTPATADRAASTELRAEKIACRRSERLLFRDLDFALTTGQALLLRGPNGSGKSSLLRLIAGLLPLEAGALFWRGRHVSGLGASYRADIAFMGHLDALKPQLPLRDNLQFWADVSGADISGTGESAAEALLATGKVDRALVDVGLGANADLPAQILSAGQRRRFGLARLLLRRAPIWLLDEPTTALDSAGQKLALRLITDHLAGGGIAVISSHDEIDLGDAVTLDLGRSPGGRA